MSKQEGAQEKPLGNCPRTVALYKPGHHMPGVNHSFSWTGAVPLTGELRCTLCGQLKDEVQS